MRDLGLPFFRPKVPFIPQMETVECGAACLAMVLGYHGHHAPLAEVRQACSVSRDGVNAYALLRAAHDYGLEAEAFRTEAQHLGDLPLPAILHWEFRHFVVLERLRRDGSADIVDPAGGRRHLSAEALGQAFTGAVLAFAPTPAFQRRAAAHPTLARYRTVISGHMPALGQLLVASFFLQIAGLIFPVAQQLLMDRVIIPKQEPWLWGLAFAMGLALLVQTALTAARTYVLDTLQLSLDLNLLKGFVGHLLRLPIGFFLVRRPGDLMQRLDSNQQIRNIFSQQIISSILDAFLVLGYGGLMLAYHLKLGLVVIAVGSLRLLFQVAIRTRTRQLLSAELAASGESGGALLESLNAIETIKAVGAEGDMVRRWMNRTIEQVDLSLRREKLDLLAGQATGLVSTLGSSLVFGLAGYEVLSGRMTIGVFSAFLSLRGLFTSPFMSLAGALGRWQHLRSHLGRLDDVMDAKPEPSGTREAGDLKGAIELDRVSFAYSAGAPPAVQDISLKIGPGQKIALVGPSGAGKTTLARLLLGMLVPTEGVIRFDGVDLGDFELSSLRARMGVVLQETFLFNDTVRGNLSLSDPTLPLERLQEAARLACIDDVIEALPEGYDTPLGEKGATLSGGQRQRISLARTLANRPAVLLLDEATSSLDFATEARVHANLHSLGCTRIVIAHRLATVRDADLILVLEEGRVVEQGTYDQLCARGGFFRSLVKAMEASYA